MLSFLESLDPNKPVCVALSGGVDSIVLADLACRWGAEKNQRIYAVHVNHGISDNAHEWTDFVEKFCSANNIAIKTAHVSLDKKPRESLEDVARKARYKALIELSPPEAQILLAHHLDDQLETILLAMKRGAGSLRLGGILPITEAPDGKTYNRPLLNATKDQILEYAKERNLSWVEDESNADSSYDRNFLRNEIIPLLKSRWEGLLTATSRTSKILQSENRIVELHTKQVLEKVSDHNGDLIIDELGKITDDERKLAIRHWIKGKGINPPREDKIEQIYKEIAMARLDRKPFMQIGKHQVFRKKKVLAIKFVD